MILKAEIAREFSEQDRRAKNGGNSMHASEARKITESAGIPDIRKVNAAVADCLGEVKSAARKGRSQAVVTFPANATEAEVKATVGILVLKGYSVEDQFDDGPSWALVSW